MMYAYCRVSTEKQSLTRQIENISKAFPEISIRDYYTEKYTGTTSDRPEWIRLQKKVKAGDTIVFDSVSRMSRDAAEGAAQYEELYTKGVNLVFLNEPHVNTDVYKDAAQAPATGDKDLDETLIKGLNEYLMRLAKRQIIIAFEQAQKERDDLSKRTKDGISAKRAERKAAGLPDGFGQNKGKTFETKKAAAAKETIRKHSKDFDGTLSDADVIKLAGISRNSYYKYKRELSDQLHQN